MKYFKLKIFAFAIALLTVLSCSVDDAEGYCYSTEYSPVTGVTGPDTTTVNVPITLNVTFNIFNGCGSFGNFAVSNNYPKEIVPVVVYEGCACTQEVATVVKPYTFTAATAGEYVLKFVSGTNTYITKTITVTQ